MAVEQEILSLLGDKKPTQENILEAGLQYMRMLIYREYPTSDPKIVEALLLMHRNSVQEILSVVNEDTVELAIAETERFGNALHKTVAMLVGENK